MAVSFNKEVILEAIQEVLAESTGKLKTVTGPSGKTVAQVVTPEEELEMKKKGAKIAPMEEDHHENPNDDSNMAKSQLYAIAKYAIELLQLIKDGDQLDAWVQAKITKAADYVDAVQHYLEGEEYLDANQEESEEELAEGDYQARTKEDLVFQYLRDAWQFGALKGKDVNPDEELSTMADSLLANLPDYDAAELGEAKKRSHSTIQTDLDDVKAKMRELAKQYSAGDKSVLAQLKDLNDEKKALEKELIRVVSKIGAGQEYKGEVDEVVQLDEIKAGEFAKIKTGTKIGLKGYGYVTVQDNDGVVLKVKDQFGEVFPINLGQYNEKALTEGVSCCGRCGRVHESAQDCKKPYISKDSPRHCKNKK